MATFDDIQEGLDGSPSIDSRRMGSLMEVLDNNKVQLMQLSENVQMLQESMTQHSIVLDELRLRQDILDVRTTNIYGVFIWKIPDIRRRYREAIDRRTVSIYSPPYFTSPQGCCMCTRVNGDGMCIVPLCFDHDNLLRWPFKQSAGRRYRKAFDRRKGSSPPYSTSPQGKNTPLLADILIEISSVVFKWKLLGLCLHVPADRLDTIDMDERGIDNKKYAMVKYWLENEEKPSWEKLAMALARIGEVDLAQVIIQKHCQPHHEDRTEKKSFFISMKEGARKIWGTLKEHTVDKIKSVLGRFGERLGIRRKYKTNKIDDNGQRKVRWWFEIKGDESILQDLEAHWKNITASESWKLEGIQAQPSHS